MTHHARSTLLRVYFPQTPGRQGEKKFLSAAIDIFIFQHTTGIVNHAAKTIVHCYVWQTYQ